MSFEASTLAANYRWRGQIDSLFRTIKQPLKIKTFVGTHAHADRVQIWTALIATLLLKCLPFMSRWGSSLSHKVALGRWNLFSHRELWALFGDPCDTPPEEGQFQSIQLTVYSILGAPA